MTIEAALGRFATRVGNAKATRKGPIVLALTGEGGGDFHLDCSGSEPRIVKGFPKDPHLVFLAGDATQVVAMLEGKKDARALFFAGIFRLRGDLRYAGQLAQELGLLKEPF